MHTPNPPPLTIFFKLNYLLLTFSFPTPPYKYKPHLVTLMINLMAMDWYSWLSKAGLDDPSLVYQYGCALTHNQLQEEDLAYFTRDILQSIGISVAKHRLEILKLAKNHNGPRSGPYSWSRLVLEIGKTKRLFTKKIGHLGVLSLRRWRSSWTRLLMEKEKNIDGLIITKNRVMRSGPLERIVEEDFMAKRTSSVSGPLDRKLQDRLMSSYWTPTLTGQKYGLSKVWDRRSSPSPVAESYYKIHGTKDAEQVELHSIWALMFQDLKPT